MARALSGRATPDEYTYMTMRQRIDFAIIALVFGVLVGVYVFSPVFQLLPQSDPVCPVYRINAFTVLTAQHLVRDLGCQTLSCTHRNTPHRNPTVTPTRSPDSWEQYCFSSVWWPRPSPLRYMIGSLRTTSPFRAKFYAPYWPHAG